MNFDESTGSLRKAYQRVKGPNDQIDNILKVHSLRPHTLIGHMYLYKNVLHHTDNTLPKWYLETIGVYVSILNNCSYCVEHHSVGLRKLVGDKKADVMIIELQNLSIPVILEDRFKAGLEYTQKLTLHAAHMNKIDIKFLRDNGLSDGEILEINQVVSYFNYANRTVLGLGVDIGGEALGHSPSSSDSSEWAHV